MDARFVSVQSFPRLLCLAVSFDAFAVIQVSVVMFLDKCDARQKRHVHLGVQVVAIDSMVGSVLDSYILLRFRGVEK